MVISERKQQILESSKKVFAGKGFYGSSSKELAASAKISEALLYKHFPTKEALFRATVEEAIAPYKKTAPPQAQGVTNFLRNAARSVLRPDKETFRLLLFAELELDINYLNEFLDIFGEEIKKYFKGSGHLKNVKPKDFEKIFTGCLTGLKMLEPQNAGQLIDEFVQLILPGLCR